MARAGRALHVPGKGGRAPRARADGELRDPARSALSRRRDIRTFGHGPYILGLERVGPGGGFPFELPAVATLDRLALDAPITLLAGDNGSGKSTIVEGIGQAMGFAAEGGELERLGERPAVPRPIWDDCVEPVLARRKPRTGYFLRAESFFNVASLVDSDAWWAPDISLYGGVDLHGQSHGQSFLALASNRFAGQGLYVMDEPEAALSISGALALVAVMVRAARAGAQFIVATHSPVVLACPDARIYELDDQGIARCDYDDVEAVKLARSFLAAPERFLRAALAELED